MERKVLFAGGVAAIGIGAGCAMCFLLCGPAASRCPTATQYSPALLERAAIELEALPEDSAIETLLEDYKAARDEARRCVE